MLDWVLVNDTDLITDIIHSAPLGKSDHETNFSTTGYKKNKIKPTHSYKFNLKRGNYEATKKDVNKLIGLRPT